MSNSALCRVHLYNAYISPLFSILATKGSGFEGSTLDNPSNLAGRGNARNKSTYFSTPYGQSLDEIHLGPNGWRKGYGVLTKKLPSPCNSNDNYSFSRPQLQNKCAIQSKWWCPRCHQCKKAKLDGGGILLSKKNTPCREGIR